MNCALQRGAELHNLKRSSRREFTAVVRSSGLAAVREAANECGAELQILKTGGTAFLLRSLLARPALTGGLAAAMLLMAFLSGRLIFVSAEGAEERIVLAAQELMENGLELRFSRAKALDRAELIERVSGLDPSIDLVRVEVDGVILRVHILTAEDGGSGEDARPASIYADRDCVIVSISASSGKPLVRAGDAVKKDQLLVSADISAESGGGERVHSEAEIIGEVARVLSVRVEPAAALPVPEGAASRFFAIELFGITLPRADKERGLAMEIKHKARLDCTFLPIFALDARSREFVIGTRKLLRKEMLAEARARLDAGIAAALPADALIVSKITELIWEEDGALTMSATVHTYEKIGTERYL